jgi:hypothetical protein
LLQEKKAMKLGASSSSTTQEKKTKDNNKPLISLLLSFAMQEKKIENFNELGGSSSFSAT